MNTEANSPITTDKWSKDAGVKVHKHRDDSSRAEFFVICYIMIKVVFPKTSLRSLCGCLKLIM